ncbi:MAG: pseudouridine-5'-phosphate glycosidase [Ferruginibacter sp.]
MVFSLEYLETIGIPVVTIGQDEFPSFYSSKSGYTSPLRLDTPDDIVALLRTKWDFGLKGSVLVANPVPVAHESGNEEIEVHIRQALSAAAVKNIKGKEVTPFLLKYIAANTEGESLQTNIALILNNTKIAAGIAVSFANSSV